MTTSRKISIEAALSWSSAHAMHTDRQLFEGVNLWRDFFPGDLGAQLQRAAVGETVRARFRAGELVPEPYDPHGYTACAPRSSWAASRTVRRSRPTSGASTRGPS